MTVQHSIVVGDSRPVADEPQLPPVKWLLGTGKSDRCPLAGLFALLVLAHGAVLPARYGFLDDYTLLYQSKVNPGSMTSHILGGGRPIFALTERVIFSQVDDIGELRLVRALALVLTCSVGIVLYRLLRSVGTASWTASGTSALLLVLPSTQVSVAWATMFIVPISMLFALSASAALHRALLASDTFRLRVLLLPCALMSLAVTSYQPGATSFWLGFAIVVLGGGVGMREDLYRLARIIGANLLVFAVGLVVGFVVLKVGVAAYGVQGVRAGTVTDVAGKVEWFATRALPRALDPWSLMPRAHVAAATLILLLLGLALLEARRPWQRIVPVALALSLIVLSYLPNLLVAENWASTRTMVGLMPMVALLVTFALRAALRGALREAGDMLSPEAGRLAEPVLLVLTAATFAVHALQVVSVYFITPQTAELAAAERALATHGDVTNLTVVPSHWSDSVAPTEHYDEHGIPSSCQAGAALGLTQLLLREQTGSFAPGVRVVDRTDLPAGPLTVPVMDYRAVLQSAPSGDRISRD